MTTTAATALAASAAAPALLLGRSRGRGLSARPLAAAAASVTGVGAVRFVDIARRTHGDSRACIRFTPSKNKTFASITTFATRQIVEEKF